ncbi:pimeloyl-ACP methyl ester carboxylesterase [Kibdelosporangium banguiense]|uniref:Pimeloyl-ACP methyl ester carboxylesterase n=1 Tax=Kibdelosporangium banguiense TaxID=1365924 RepID=A0ABS4U210_9PSEU|nr:alpha/beta hydrolase [Kibdelosporangium banguiense]MBP2330263.1 pimeloyl-ACP methyl ester carboxylesterase [Kibdelosporangium banguiense]
MIKAFITAAVLATAVVPTSAAAAAADLDWRDCGNGLLCAEVAAPADWSRPAGDRIKIGLAKLPARDQSRKIGTLVHNLGGPAAVIEYLPALKDAYAELTEWFDVVVFDPRGMGASSNVSCPQPPPYTLQWAYPSRSDYTGFADANRLFAAQCPPAPLRLDSWQVAHDMEAIRIALKQRKLNYFGNSYGTVFGQAYAELYGRNVGRMYLDSVVDHTNPDFSSWTAAKAATSEQNLREFTRWCEREEACALHGQDAMAVWDRVVERAMREPIPAPGAAMPASAALIVGQARVQDHRKWPEFSRALAQADAGDGSAFVPPLPPPPGSLGSDMSRVMYCADFPYETRYDALKQVEGKLRATVAPHIGWAHAWSHAAVHCAGLPARHTFPPHRIQPAQLPPVLIASGSDDQTTPPEHAQRVARQLPGARYLPAKGNHALYVSGNPCVRQYVHQYLRTGALPGESTRC